MLPILQNQSEKVSYFLFDGCCLKYIFLSNCNSIPFELTTPDGTATSFKPSLPCEYRDSWPRHGYRIVNPDPSPSLFIAETNSSGDAAKILQSLRATATICNDEIKPGYYLPDNVFLYVQEGCKTDQDLVKEIFGDKEVRRHSNVAFLVPICGRRQSAYVLRYNLYADRVEKSRFDFGQTGSSSSSVLDLFPPFDMMVRLDYFEFFKLVKCVCQFKGYTLRIGFLPYSYWGTADYIADAADYRRMYENHTGADVWTMEETCKVFMDAFLKALFQKCT